MTSRIRSPTSAAGGFRTRFRHCWPTVTILSVVSQSVTAEEPPVAQPEAALLRATLHAGPVDLTPGGFIELTALYRKRNETADIGSSFGAIPFPNNSNYRESEFRQTERNSRLSLLAEAPVSDANRVSGYFESDFVSAGASSNSIESNSYTLRVRQLYFSWERPERGWAITAGQAWSLATMLRKGLAPRSEDIPLVDDGQYVAGFVWTRQTQLRIVKSFSGAMAVGISFEAPQNAMKGTAPPGVIAGNPGGPGFSGSTSYSADVAPDVVIKWAYDPGFAHFELFSLTRFLHDRAATDAVDPTTSRSHTTAAQSFGGGLIVPLWPGRLDLHVSGIVGRGNGRYGSAQLGDSTYNPSNGSVEPLHQAQGLIGVVDHATRDLDFFAYHGYEDQRAAYGLVPLDNSACNAPYASTSAVVAKPACGGVGIVRHYVGGFLWKFYKGSLGYIHGGPEVEYVKNRTYLARNGTTASTDNVMVYLTVRYFPFQ